jgi:hypothetical protein
MGRQLQRWRSENGEKLWLSMLIDAMDKVSREKASREKASPLETCAVSCDRLVLAAVSAQLARPPAPCVRSPYMHSPYMHGASHFRLRN